jgi:hypothetical protein
MWKKIWKNRLEFYPYLAIYLFWFMGAFLNSFQVQNRPGIVALGVQDNFGGAYVFQVSIKFFSNLAA